MKNKKIIFVAYYFPPIKAIGSLRPYYLSRELSRQGWDVHVISTKNKDIFCKDVLETGFLKSIGYICSFDLQKIKSIKEKTFRKLFKYKKNNHAVLQSFSNRKFLNSFLVNISYEGGWIFIFLSVLAIQKKIREEKIKYIYSTFSPYSNHIIAYILKKINKELIWVADFRDLPPGISDDEIYAKKIQSFFNKRIFNRADIITTVSSGLKRNLNKFYDNVFVIHNGYDLLRGSVKKNGIGNFNITYTGNLYGGKRNLVPLMEALVYIIKKHENINFIYAGKDSVLVQKTFEEYCLTHILIDKGVVDRKIALELQHNADVNLMLTWATKTEKGVLTGKFFEYIQSGKPILCLINGEKDEELKLIVKRCNVGDVFYNKEIEDIRFFILQLITKEKEYSYCMKEVSKFSYKMLGQKLNSLLNKLDKGLSIK